MIVANEKIAAELVQRLIDFRTPVAFGATWRAYAVSEVLTALNEASRRLAGRRRSSRDPSMV